MKVDYTFRELYAENEKSIKRLKRLRWFTVFVAVLCAGTAVYDWYIESLMWAAVQAVLFIVNLYLAYRNTKTLQKAYGLRETIQREADRWGWDT